MHKQTIGLILMFITFFLFTGIFEITPFGWMLHFVPLTNDSITYADFFELLNAMLLIFGMMFELDLIKS